MKDKMIIEENPCIEVATGPLQYNNHRYYVSPDYRSSKDVELQNKLYALICPRLESNESRGV